MNVEIINTGNELLNGKIQNTNVDWLIKQLHKIGARVIRYCVIPDDIEVISTTLTAALHRSADIIITTGGLGATYDDMTITAVAKVVKRPLILNNHALAMVESKFEYARKLGWTHVELIDEHWKKMAEIPEGSTPIENPPGAAPAVQTEYEGKTIFSLPGPPNELKSIFRTYIRPFLKKRIKTKLPETHFYIKGLIEPTISGIIDETHRKFQGVWVKSHPMLHTGKVMLEIHMTLEEGYDSAELLEKAKTHFLSSITNLGDVTILNELEGE